MASYCSGGSATITPARWMTTSLGGSSARGSASTERSPCTSFTWAGSPPALRGERTSAVTSSPRSTSRRHRWRPMNPVAPVTKTRMVRTLSWLRQRAASGPRVPSPDGWRRKDDRPAWRLRTSVWRFVQRDPGYRVKGAKGNIFGYRAPPGYSFSLGCLGSPLHVRGAGGSPRLQRGKQQLAGAPGSRRRTQRRRRFRVLEQRGERRGVPGDDEPRRGGQRDAASDVAWNRLGQSGIGSRSHLASRDSDGERKQPRAPPGRYDANLRHDAPPDFSRCRWANRVRRKQRANHASRGGVGCSVDAEVRDRRWGDGVGRVELDSLRPGRRAGGSRDGDVSGAV